MVQKKRLDEDALPSIEKKWGALSRQEDKLHDVLCRLGFKFAVGERILNTVRKDFSMSSSIVLDRD